MNKAGKVILIIFIIAIILLLGIETGILISIRQNPAESTDESVNTVRPKVENTIKNETVNTIKESENTTKADNATVKVETIDTVELIKSAMKKQIEEHEKSSGAKLSDYKIGRIIICDDNEKQSILNMDAGATYQKDDIFAYVNYSVKPANEKSKEIWSAGNGTENGEWIENKTVCVRVRETDVKIGGSGW